MVILTRPGGFAWLDYKKFEIWRRLYVATEKRSYVRSGLPPQGVKTLPSLLFFSGVNR
jgi:hypothetical protein